MGKSVVGIEWFNDCIPVDELIAPMVLFFQENGIRTFQSCQGGKGHLYGRPTISFHASTIKEIDFVANLLHKNDIDTSLEVGLMTGFFTRDVRRYGQASWLWAAVENDLYKERVYDRVIKLVDMKKIAPITGKRADRNLMKKLYKKYGDIK